MLCLVYVVLYHAIFAGFLLYSHCQAHGFNWVQAALAVFQAINAWIAVCEIALLTYSGKIQQVHKDSEAKLGVGRLPPVFLFEDVAFGRLFSLEYWSVMWSTYCALDPSYADTTTFGFCVDIGNGVTTLVPTVLFALGMTWPLLPPRWLGMMGLIMHYQARARAKCSKRPTPSTAGAPALRRACTPAHRPAPDCAGCARARGHQEFYGTCIYFFQYCFNGRYKRSPRSHVFGIVVPANGIWMAFPALGMWASAQLILDGDFSVFR